MRFRLSVLFVVAIFVVTCGVDVSHERALSEWRRNEEIVDVAIREGRSDADQYLQSVIFFGRVTGLSISGNASTFGLLPDKNTARDFLKVKEWCKRNCQNLYWDEKSQSVKVSN